MNAFKRNRVGYKKRLELALVLTLAATILLFILVPKRFERHVAKLPPVIANFTLEEVPVTRQLVKRGHPIPTRPVIPLPTEELSVPEYETIDETNIKWDLGDSPFAFNGLTMSRADTIPPRPLLQVFPEYPDEERKRNARGNVRLLIKVSAGGKVVNVVVSRNTTGSDLCAKAAIDAAYRSLYVPARSANRFVDMWTICDYGFKPE